MGNFYGLWAFNLWVLWIFNRTFLSKAIAHHVLVVEITTHV